MGETSEPSCSWLPSRGGGKVVTGYGLCDDFESLELNEKLHAVDNPRTLTLAEQASLWFVYVPEPHPLTGKPMWGRQRGVAIDHAVLSTPL